MYVCMCVCLSICKVCDTCASLFLSVAALQVHGLCNDGRPRVALFFSFFSISIVFLPDIFRFFQLNGSNDWKGIIWSNTQKNQISRTVVQPWLYCLSLSVYSCTGPIWWHTHTHTHARIGGSYILYTPWHLTCDGRTAAAAAADDDKTLWPFSSSSSSSSCVIAHGTHIRWWGEPIRLQRLTSNKSLLSSRTALAVILLWWLGAWLRITTRPTRRYRASTLQQTVREFFF